MDTTMTPGRAGATVPPSSAHNRKACKASEPSTLRLEPCEIQLPALGQALGAILAVPSKQVPALLMVHGWDSSQNHYQARAEDFAALGFVCLTFDLRGHGDDDAQSDTVNRADNMQDVLAAYDKLAAHPDVDACSIGMIGTSYGGYLAALATSSRAVRWLALRVPALYEDDEWTLPKAKLNRDELMAYRRQINPFQGNRALSACAAFRGDVLIVGSGADDVVPPPTMKSYVRSFESATSLTYRTIAGADHELSEERMRRTYDSILHEWILEMLLGARAQIGA